MIFPEFFTDIILVLLIIITANIVEPIPLPVAPENNTANFLPPINKSETHPELLPLAPDTSNNQNNENRIEVNQIDNIYDIHIIATLIILGIITIIIFMRKSSHTKIK